MADVNAKVIMFPKEKTKKIKSLQKEEARRMFLSLSIFSVALFAILIGERINNSQRPQYVLAGAPDRLEKLNRAIASARPMDVIEEIQKEHQLTKKIEESGRKPAAIGKVPSAADELRFGTLAGKYRIAEDRSKINEIEFVSSSDSGEHPVVLQNSEEFLKQYRQSFSLGFDRVEKIDSTAKVEVYRLFDHSGKLVGKASFQYDSAGRFLSLRVQE